MSGTLYLIPNVLGVAHPTQPLFDVIPTQVQQLIAGLDYLVVENAKTTRAFLKLISTNFPLAKPLQEIHIDELNNHTRLEQLPTLITPLLNGHDVGLMSEAGVPAVADPGAQLVRLAHQNHIIVRPMVGPSSLLLALMASGLNGQQFAFDGYLPIELHARHQRIKALEQRSRQENQTQIVIETPYRNLSLLESLCKTCDPHTELCVATDLTLSSESIQTRSIGEWRTLLTRHASPNLNKRPTVFLFLACK